MSKHTNRINCLKSWIKEFPTWQKRRHTREARETDKAKNNGRVIPVYDKEAA